MLNLKFQILLKLLLFIIKISILKYYCCLPQYYPLKWDIKKPYMYEDNLKLLLIHYYTMYMQILWIYNVYY